MRDFGSALKQSISLQKSVPDFIEGMAFTMRITVEPTGKGAIRLLLLPELIPSQSDPAASQKIQGYNFREEKLEDQDLISYLQQVAYC